MKQIGFIGLGKMGLPMALNLCRKGFAVWSHSSHAESQKQLQDAGGKLAPDFAWMAAECDVLVSIVPADREIGELLDVVLTHGHEGLVWIEMTSAMGTTKQAAQEKLHPRKIALVDAPVSGGTAGAQQGTLTIMVGAEADVLEAQRDVLEAMGTQIYHTGPVGSGSNVKMLNQMLNAANTAIAAEVLCLSRKLGVGDGILSQVVNKSSGGSYIFERNVPKYMMTGDHTPGFRLDLMKKDVGLFIQAAREADEFIPVSNLIAQLYAGASHQGLGDQNYTAIHTWYEKNQK